MEGLDVFGHDEDATGKDQHQRDDAESANSVQAKEDVCSGAWSTSPIRPSVGTALTGTGRQHLGKRWTWIT